MADGLVNGTLLVDPLNPMPAPYLYFMCQCLDGWSGADCRQPPTVSPPPPPSAPLCGSFTLLATEKEYNCGVVVPPFSVLSVSTCRDAINGAACTGNVSLTAVAETGATQENLPPSCGGCPSLADLQNPHAVPALFVVRASCGGTACGGSIATHARQLVTNCTYSGGKFSECLITVPTNFLLTARPVCDLGNMTQVLMDVAGEVLVETRCTQLFYPAWTGKALVLRHYCHSSACHGSADYTLTPLPPTCPPFALIPGKKQVTCAIQVPGRSSVTLQNVCWSPSECAGNTTVTYTDADGATGAANTSCADTCAYGAYTNYRNETAALAVRQMCAPAYESSCAGRTAYEFEVV